MRQFIIVNEEGERTSKGMDILELLNETDFNANDIESVMALEVGDTYYWPGEGLGVKRIK